MDYWIMEVVMEDMAADMEDMEVVMVVMEVKMCDKYESDKYEIISFSKNHDKIEWWNWGLNALSDEKLMIGTWFEWGLKLVLRVQKLMWLLNYFIKKN